SLSLRRAVHCGGEKKRCVTVPIASGAVCSNFGMLPAPNRPLPPRPPRPPSVGVTAGICGLPGGVACWGINAGAAGRTASALKKRLRFIVERSYHGEDYG